jgi:predicted nucleotidyltransferase
MAKGNYREYLQSPTVKLKKYLYVLRPLLACQWIEQGRGPAPMLFQVLVDELAKDAQLRAAIDALLVQKRGTEELAEAPRVPALNYFIEVELERCARIAGSIPTQRAAPEAYTRADEFLRKVVLA